MLNILPEAKLQPISQFVGTKLMDLFKRHIFFS